MSQSVSYQGGHRAARAAKNELRNLDCKGNFPHFAELEVGSYWMGVVVTYQPQTSLELHKWNAIYIPKFVCRLLLFLSYLCLKSLGVKT